MKINTLTVELLYRMDAPPRLIHRPAYRHTNHDDIHWFWETS